MRQQVDITVKLTFEVDADMTTEETKDYLESFIDAGLRIPEFDRSSYMGHHNGRNYITVVELKEEAQIYGTED